MKKPGANGFTLMEVMITVVIIGILAAIAYPSYTNYVTAARRSDATINLTRIAALQEKFFTRCGRYADNLIGTPIPCGPAPATAIFDAGLAAGGVTRDGYYTLTATVTPGPPPLGGGAGAPGGGGFTLTAAPALTQATADLTKCTTLTLANTGAKDATGSDSPVGTNGGKCWKK